MECRAQMDSNESEAGLPSCILSLGFPSSFKHSNFKRQQNTSLLKLDRIRDIVSLWLSYPVRTVHDSKLKTWIHRVSNERGSIAEKYCPIQESPLRYLEGLVPTEMMMDNVWPEKKMMDNEMEEGGSSMFDDDDSKIPDAIHNLAADLAINQLVQTLISGDDHVRNINHAMISTRNNDERRQVFDKMKVVLKDMENMPRFNEIFKAVLWVDDEQNGCAQRDGLLNFSQNDPQRLISRKILQLRLLDGNAEKTTHKRKVSLSTRMLVKEVLVITESQKQAHGEKTMAMDLTISTNDHLLPWKVFCQNVCNKLVFSSSAIQKIAVRIVQECGGHLLAIVLVAKSLKKVEDIKLWELALSKLRCLDPLYDMNMFQGVTKVMVIAFINFVWNDLNQTLKHCLKSCLFIPDIKTGKLSNELMYYWISYRLTDVREATHNLRELVECSILLQDQLDDKYVQLPEDTYAILDSLNTQTPMFMKKSGLGLTEPPKDELWHSVVHMELANNKLSELPLSPNSPELKVLMLQENADLTRIPYNFFFKMPLLWILDISYTNIRELPDSLFELQQLRELYLKGCECFMRLSSKIGKLKKLEKLDLEGTQIIHLPKEVQELTNLESLILCFYEFRGKKSKQYTFSTIIPSEVISKLKGLKHLSIDVNPDDERWYENVQDILPEILGLKQLLTLSLYIPHLELLKLIPAYIFEVDFRLIVGRHTQRIISSTPPTWEAKFKQSDCSLRFVNVDDIPSEIKQLVRHSKALFLERHKAINNLSEFKMMNLEQLRVCMLAECREMQTVVDGRQSNGGNDIFSHLLYLYISHMKSLRNIWEGPMPSRCFLGLLKSLVLQNCPELTTVFTLDFLGNLSLLKELIVNDCPKLTTLISGSSFEHEGEIFLPKLRKILLLHLPKLINISNGCHIGPSLKTMAIYDCPKLQSLSEMELSSQNLKVIKGESKWWDSLQWSKEEWGIAYRPSMFDYIFSSINNQVDIMTQFGVDDDDIDNGDIDDDPDKTQLQPSSARLLTDSKQNADRNSRDIINERERKEVRERCAFKTKSEVEIIDDGYKWRKYETKMAKNNSNPRYYYKCLAKGCPVKKRVERDRDDPMHVITTYKGIHAHHSSEG